MQGGATVTFNFSLIPLGVWFRYHIQGACSAQPLFTPSLVLFFLVQNLLYSLEAVYLVDTSQSLVHSEVILAFLVL